MRSAMEHNAAQDGSVYKSSYANSRQITITLSINGPADINRVALYRYFKSKFYSRLRYVTAQRDVYAEGYVQSLQVAYFAKKETMQIVVQCPRAYLNGSENSLQEFSLVNPLFEFPFDIGSGGIPFSEIIIDMEQNLQNAGDVETGAVFTLRAVGAVDTPKLYRIDTSEHMFFNLQMAAGDRLVVNTRQNEKRITLISGGVETNEIGSLVNGSSWFVLKPGDNIFSVDAASGAANLIVTVEMIDLYEGV